MADLPNNWKTSTQEYLNWAYDQSQHSSNMNELLDRYKSESVLVREEIGCPSRYMYGSTDDEGIDVYIPKTSKHNGAVIFMHGGAWKTGFAKNYSFFAKPFLDLGYAVFIPDFANVVTLNGNLFSMADQACRAIQWSLSKCKDFGVNENNVHLIGHSSGAHLSAVYASNFNNYCSNSPRIKHMMLFSGLYDLEPVMVSSRKDYLTLSDSDILELSPIKNLEHISIATDIICGSLDSPEFIRQSEEFYLALFKKNKKINFSCLENLNHFEMLEKIKYLFIERNNNESNI